MADFDRVTSLLNFELMLGSPHRCPRCGWSGLSNHHGCPNCGNALAGTRPQLDETNSTIVGYMTFDTRTGEIISENDVDTDC